VTQGGKDLGNEGLANDCLEKGTVLQTTRWRKGNIWGNFLNTSLSYKELLYCCVTHVLEVSCYCLQKVSF